MRLFTSRPQDARVRPCAAGLLVLLLLTGGCGDDEPRAVAEIETDTEVLYFEPIGRGQRASLSDTTLMLVRDSARWADLREQLSPMAPFEPVDFGQAMVALVAVPAPTAGYLTEITAIEQAGDSILVTYTRTRPGDDCATALGRTVPFEAVLVRQAPGTPVFREEIEILRCDLGGPF